MSTETAAGRVVAGDWDEGEDEGARRGEGLEGAGESVGVGVEVGVEVEAGGSRRSGPGQVTNHDSW